jgi:uncharacterized protein YjbJ (UPF0337 family)
MNKDELKGKGENLKGRVKEAAGSLSGDKRTQAEGTFDRVSGAVREKVGKAKREVSRDVSREDEDE